MAIQAASGEHARKRARRRASRPWLRAAALVVLWLVGAVTLSMIAFRFVNPPITAVMAVDKARGAKVRQTWVLLENMSPYLPLAVIASEDGRFCAHWGIDWGAVRDAVNEGGGWAGFRGASTISMQTAKNLYLWNGRSYVRKTLEAPLAYLMNFLWPKERTMEIYLNIAQFGPGLFGAEAASRHYFGKSASQLTRREAVLLAVALPAPRFRNPARPSPRMLRIARAVDLRLPIIAKRAGCVMPQR
jgi:monofunctional biosynthetic peptidoglycan transglycosylase